MGEGNGKQALKLVKSGMDLLITDMEEATPDFSKCPLGTRYAHHQNKGILTLLKIAQIELDEKISQIELKSQSQQILSQSQQILSQSQQIPQFPLFPQPSQSPSREDDAEIEKTGNGFKIRGKDAMFPAIIIVICLVFFGMFYLMIQSLDKKTEAHSELLQRIQYRVERSASIEKGRDTKEDARNTKQDIRDAKEDAKK